MAIDRRGFLGALALTPAALAACATADATGERLAPGEEGAPPAGAPAPPAADAAIAAVRRFPLGAGAEPALVFRAAAARPGEP